MKKTEQLKRAELAQMPEHALTALLHRELEKEMVSDDYVRLILQELESRQTDMDSRAVEDCAAVWQNFKTNCEEDQKRIAVKKPKNSRQWILSAAAMVAVVALLVIVAPTASGANNVINMLADWTNSVFEFFNPSAEQPTYVFKTDNPGLQKVYDAVTGLGVTQSVVPMWIPEGYELVELKITNTPTKVKAYAVFANADDRIVYLLNLYGVEAPYKYETEETGAIKLEIEEITHFIEHNENAWVAVWSRENVQCSLTVDCQEDALYEILKSIYKLEGS